MLKCVLLLVNLYGCVEDDVLLKVEFSNVRGTYGRVGCCLKISILENTSRNEMLNPKP